MNALQKIKRGAAFTVALVAGLAVAGPVQAEEDRASLEGRVHQLERLLIEVVREANSEETATTQFHLSGYASAGFITSEEEPDSFTVGSFNPGFHFQYTDKLLFEAETEIETNEDGETEVELEYADLSYFVGDNVVVKLGKWLSPIGQFQERLHPSWINKLPDTPVGFGHGGAQPLSDVGIQLRGGWHAGDGLFALVVAVGNGPRGGHHGPELEGFGADDNDNKALSARVSYLPVPQFEIGVSALTAKSTGEEAGSGTCDAAGVDQACEPTEGDYDLVGFDLTFTPAYWDFRGEYIQSELGEHFSRAGHGDLHTTRLDATEWTAWYVQAAYQFAGITSSGLMRNLEFVVRYGDLDIKGHFEGEGETRLTAGINYLFAPSVIGKLAVESRQFDEDGAEDENRFLAQFTFGF